MSAVFSYEQQLEATSCCVCGIQFGVPPYFIANARKNAGSLYCPNGHRLGWSETEAEKLRKQLDAERNRVEFFKREAEQARVLARAAKASTTKVKKKLERIEKGVCPQCNRTFSNVARHMQTKHGVECNQPPAGSKTRAAA